MTQMKVRPMYKEESVCNANLFISFDLEEEKLTPPKKSIINIVVCDSATSVETDLINELKNIIYIKRSVLNLEEDKIKKVTSTIEKSVDDIKREFIKGISVFFLDIDKLNRSKLAESFFRFVHGAVGILPNYIDDAQKFFQEKKLSFSKENGKSSDEENKMYFEMTDDTGAFVGRLEYTIENNKIKYLSKSAFKTKEYSNE